MKHILGVSAGYHDAALAVIREDGEIVFAGHSERYSKIKNDSELSIQLIDEAFNFPIDTIAYYERPWMHNIQQLRSGEHNFGPWRLKSTLEQAIGTNRIRGRTLKSYPHHLSHAAAGFQTSPFERATVVVIDAIGELDTISIWAAEYVNGIVQYRKLWGQKYPHSIGLFYSAMTKRAGLKPMEEEYILMGMAAYGRRGTGYWLQNLTIENEWDVKFQQNMHIGADDILPNIGNEDVAAASQYVAETLVLNVMRRAKDFGWSNNLVYAGGVALNCSINQYLGEYFDNIWIMPNPGDAGSSIGAAALAYGRPVNWSGPYLGHNIAGPYPVNTALDLLRTDRICGVASGKAEFGPRALGNRSLLADPRGNDIKDAVNEIKRRQKFRPFAPVILEEFASQHFYMPRNWKNSPYMQTIALCKRPDLFPAICHYDNTSRVQTVAKDCGSGIRELLEKWYVMTGCPMLLNTSLNIRGEPMVNDRHDADRFEQQYGIKVVS